MKSMFSSIILLFAIMVTSLCFAIPTLTTPTATSLGSNMATLSLQSNENGTGYFTLRPGMDTSCGDGNKVAFGPYSTGSYHGSIPLNAGQPSTYTVRNLPQNSNYTICFTADNSPPAGSNLNTTPAFSNMSTNSAKAFAISEWSVAGNTGFSAGAAYSTALAFAQDGTPYVAYQDGSSSNKATVMKYNAGVWSSVGGAGFSAEAASTPSPVFAPDGTLYVVYGGDDYISSRATVMKFNSGSWSVVGGGGFSADIAVFTSLAFAPDGTPYVAYSDISTNGTTTVMKFNGVGWELVGNAGFSAGDAYYVSLAFAPNGTPYVAYQDGGNNSKATVMKYSAGAWNAVGNAGFSTGGAYYTSLAIAPDGTPYVAYQDAGSSSKATVMKFSSGSWNAVGNAGFSAGGVYYTSLSIAPDGTPYVAYQDGSNSSKATVMQFSAGAWRVVGSAGFSAGGANFTALAIAPDGTPHVAYQDLSRSYKASVMKLINLAPTISGTPPMTASLGAPYAFTPTATNAASFNVSSKFPLPSWLNFDGATGALNGTPDTTGIIEDIVITAISEAGSASLPAFSITVSDLTVPDTVLNSSPPDPTAATDYAFAFTATPSAGASFECSLNGGAFGTCSGSGSHTGNYVYPSCSTCRIDTAMSFAVRAINGAGTDLSPATYIWTINHTLVIPLDNVAGGGEVQLKAADYSGDFNINRPGIAFSLKGGYDPGYSTNSGLTNIRGSITITSGTVIMENIVIL